MRKMTNLVGLLVVFPIFIFSIVFIFKDTDPDEIGFYDLSSTASRAPYGSIEPLKKKYVDEVASKFTQDELMDGSKLTQIL
jgi:hypothetical protein